MRAVPMPLALLLLSLLAGCNMAMRLPPEFLRLERSGSHYKAITPDDGRLWVRSFDDAAGGTLEFWATTLQHDLVERRGYQLVGSTAVKDGAGHDGRQLECRTDADGERYGYLVAVFVLPKTWWPWASPQVLVAEFTAREAVFQSRLGAVQQAIATLQP